jgi:ribosomal protein S18 acetylase RimI-like enzyme
MSSMPSGGHETVLREIAFGTADYERERRLREDVLRRPLGLSLKDEGAAEERQLHFGLFRNVDELVACVIAAPSSPTEARIRQMAVAPAHQGRGLGRTLLREVERRLRERGFRQLTLSARSTAVGFYEKMGYRIVGDEYVSVTVPHFWMVKTLE